MFSLGYNSLTELKICNNDSYLTGSSRYKHVGTAALEKHHYKSFREISGGVYNRYLQAIKFCDINGMNYDTDALMEYEPHGPEIASYINQYRRVRTMFDQKTNNPNRSYTLNKTKVRKKITALCRLNDAKQFIAFYSISFPVNAPDDVLYKIFNKWLTNCRTRYNLKTYLWVAERQGNGTLHFHLLTTNYMDIKAVNTAMAIAIDNEVIKETIAWGNSSKDSYNGVDVDSPQRPKKRQNETREQYRKRLNNRKKVDIKRVTDWISGYLTKYLTKNDIVFNRLPWHCSRDISALFTSIMIADRFMDECLQHLPDEVDNYNIIECGFATIHIFRFRPSDDLFAVLDSANEMVFKHIHDKLE